MEIDGLDVPDQVKMGMMLAANLGGRGARAVGAERLALAGAVLVALGLYLIAYWDATTTVLSLVAQQKDCSALNCFRAGNLAIGCVKLHPPHESVVLQRWFC